MTFKQRVNKRTIFMGVFITLLFFLLIFRTFYIQAIEAPNLKLKAKNIWNSSTILEPKRGKILDRNGEILAYNAVAYTVVAILSKDYSNHVTDPNLTARQLAPILNMKENVLYSLLTKDAYQVEIRPGGWKIDKEIADKIKALELPGILLKEETKRYYPNNFLASHVLGFVNYDNEAVMGIERYYNQLLTGKQGQMMVMKDLKGYELPDGEMLFQPAKDGADIILTIDKTIQQYVESALDKAEKKYNPKKMVAIVVNPKTGEILAMANRPNYNPNKYWGIKDYRNYTINYLFEPGSTFKIITLAAAIEEGKFDENATYMSGSIKVPGGVIRDHNNGKGWGKITYLEGIKRSSNVAFVKLGYEMLGKEKLFSYIDEFGFGQPTGIDLNGESSGIMKDVNDAYPLDVAAISFGQGVAVTPIQQVMAVSAVANGGYLMTPYIVKEIKDSQSGEMIQKKVPVVKKRVISEKTAKKVQEILEEVVKFGQKPGYIEGYHVAGKTGTAQKIGADGKYLKNEYIVSYIGFAPSNDPKLLIYVVVDEPDLNIPYYGSTIAAPIFKDIMKNSLRYLKVPMDSKNKVEEKNDKTFLLEDYIEQPIVNSKTELSDLGLLPIVIGDGSFVLEQYPKPGSKVVRGTRIYLITSSKDKIRVPDFRGKSLREALEYSYALDIKVKVNGNGIVVRQSIEPNSIYDGQEIELILEDPANVLNK
ncbi:hypothetical protein BHF71_09130 [Vulcanibacillus modesticaldus]|uniref:serine-type D-Ala-D-Ala carboxypeptidase n=1 Tax=Vulcanibacillus modesticaldus TaxID=337097 RepID=A0A1D2YUC1_9BACI|nr:PASTA domain-containing penicillin-binding protein [Vulcanibacillus modesticaldus]OEF99277.1 hypothetical protein BHF71_09130 [Vulcanibacillus modesticaldus]